MERFMWMPINELGSGASICCSLEPRVAMKGLTYRRWILERQQLSHSFSLGLKSRSLTMSAKSTTFCAHFGEYDLIPKRHSP